MRDFIIQVVWFRINNEFNDPDYGVEEFPVDPAYFHGAMGQYEESIIKEYGMAGISMLNENWEHNLYGEDL